MTTADERGDGQEPYDPLIAERFRALERLTPPDLDLAATAAAPADVTTLRPAGSNRARILAVAAAVAVIAAASAAVLTAIGDSPAEIETTDAAGSTEESTIRSSGEADTSTTSVLEVSGADAGAGGDGADAGDPADDPAAATTGSTEAPASTSSSEATTSSTQPAANESSSTTSSSIVLIPEPEGITTFTGTVTAVFTDCQSHLSLDDNGAVQSLGPASCDGGSWIELDGVRIRTSSGYTTSDQAYDRHWQGLQPGVTATVTAIAPGGRGQLTLDCPLCGIAVGSDDRRAGNGNGNGNGNGLGNGNGGGNGKGSGQDGGSGGLDPDDLNQPGGPGGGANT